jgi:hypothetical protein
MRATVKYHSRRRIDAAQVSRHVSSRFTHHRRIAVLGERLAVVLALLLASEAFVGTQDRGRTSSASGAPDDEAVLRRVSAYVERYYARAQRVVAEEAVTIQPLRYDLTADGFARSLVNETRIEWDPTADGGRGSASAVRQLLRVGNRPARPTDEPGCTDPRPISPEPLAFLIPSRYGEFTFSHAGMGRVDRRVAVRLDYAPVTTTAPPVVTWRDECVSIDLPGRTRGRVWADPETGTVLRLDERIVGSVEIPVPRTQQKRGGRPTMTVERAESSIRYRLVTFDDPAETVMLPERIESLTIVRDSGSPRLRITQVFRNYRRFLTASRVVE